MSKRIQRQARMIEDECRRLATLPPSALAISGDESIGPSIRSAFSAPSAVGSIPLTIHLTGVAQDQYDRVAQSSAGIILDAIIELHDNEPDVAREFADLRELIFSHGWQPRTERLFRLALADPRVQPKNGVALLSSRHAQALSDKAAHDVGMLTLETWKHGCFGFVDAPPIPGWGERASTHRLRLADVGVRPEILRYFRGYNDVDKPALRKAHLDAWSRLLTALDEMDEPALELTASARTILRARAMCKVLLDAPNPPGSEIRLVQKRALLTACMVEGTAFGARPTEKEEEKKEFEQMAEHLQSLTLGYVHAAYDVKPFADELKEFVRMQPQFVPPFSLLAEAVDFVKRIQLLLDRKAVPFTQAPAQSTFATLESDELRRLAEHLRTTLGAIQSSKVSYRPLPPRALFDPNSVRKEDCTDVAERCGWLADLHIRDQALSNQYRVEAALMAELGVRHATTPEARHRAGRLRWMFDREYVHDFATALVNGGEMGLPVGILGASKVDDTLFKLRLAHAAARWRTVEMRRRLQQVAAKKDEGRSISDLTTVAAQQCKQIHDDFQRIYAGGIDRGAESLALMSGAMAWLWTLQSLCAVDAETLQVAESKTIKDIVATMELALMLATWLQVRQWLPNVRLPEARDKAQVFFSYKRVAKGDSLADQLKARLTGDNGHYHANFRVLMDTGQEVQHDLEWLKRLFIEQLSADATVCFVDSAYAASPWCVLEAKIAGLRVQLDAGKYELYILRTEPLDFTDTKGDVRIWSMPAPLNALSTFAELGGGWHEPTMVALTQKLEKHCAFARTQSVGPEKSRSKRKVAEE